MFENHPEFFRFHDSCKLKTGDVPYIIGHKGNEVWMNLYFEALNDTSLIGYLDKNIIPSNLITITASSHDGKSYPLLIHSSSQQLYSDVGIPKGTYGINATWERMS